MKIQFVAVIVIRDGVEHGAKSACVVVTVMDMVIGAVGYVNAIPDGRVINVKYLKRNIAIIMDPLVELDIVDMGVSVIPDGLVIGARLKYPKLALECA